MNLKLRRMVNQLAAPLRSSAASALLCVIMGCTQLAAQDARPPEPQPQMQALIGDYVSGRDVVYVSEVTGQLRVRTSAFRSNPANQPGITLDGNSVTVNGRRYLRRDVAQGTFRISPVRPVEQLRVEALAASPPPQPDTLLKPDLVELRAH